MTAHYDAFVGGKWLPAESGEIFSTANPATGETIATVALGGAADVETAVQNSCDAFRVWRSTLPAERGRVLSRIAQAIREKSDMLANLESSDTGKPLLQARGDVETAARYFEFYAGLSDKIHGETIPLGEGYLSYTIKEPFGVVGLITPWNAPIVQAARGAAPALVVGNTVVAKPAELAPLSTLLLAEIAIESGLPPGVLNVVPGYGETAGAALVANPRVRKVAFTGSVETGRSVAATAGNRLVPVTLELGGKSANIIFEDADLGAAVAGAIASINLNAGQICSAGSRLLVPFEMHDEIVSRLVEVNSHVRVGADLASVDMGSLISDLQRRRVLGYLELARQEGANVIEGGAAALPKEGSFVNPAIVVGVNNNMRIAREEVFGPVLSVIGFGSEEEAIAIANDSPYGLVAGLWTRDLTRAHRVAAQLEVGQVYVNQYYAGGVETPFGGYKDSGFGREKGVEAVAHYMQLKTVIVKL